MLSHENRMMVFELLIILIMDIENLRAYCLKKKSVTEGFPFGEDTLVFKVKGKIFLLAGLGDSPLQFNVKADPDRAIELRDMPDAIQPGYHMNKKHWNTIVVDGSVSSGQLKQWIDQSYELVSVKKKK